MFLQVSELPASTSNLLWCMTVCVHGLMASETKKEERTVYVTFKVARMSFNNF